QALMRHEPAHTLVQQSVSTLRQPLRPVTSAYWRLDLDACGLESIGLTAAGKTSFGHQLAYRTASSSAGWW
ncbi:MAG: hypothetical protein ACRDQI_01200, partial [Pseudonocardiaceae bacterium]